jgi:ABC-type lipoprotein release transport system permease subunit
VVAVALVASVVTLVDSIDLTVMTMYGYQRHFSAITPRNSLVLNQDIADEAKRDPRIVGFYPTRPAFTVVKTIFGKMPFVVFGLDENARNELLDRCGLRIKTGRMVEEGAPEVLLHEDIALNRHLKLGDIVLEPSSEDSYSPVPARLVGTLSGPVWLAITSESFVKARFLVSPQGYVVMAGSESEQRALDRSLDKVLDKSRSRLWTYSSLVRDTREALSSLYLIMNVVIAIIIFAIAFLTGMLANIYFMQRLPEFATLAAIGYQRHALLRRVLAETGFLCVFGWALGSLLTIVVLISIRETIMRPRGLLLDAFDVAAYRYTIPLPLSICFFAVWPISRKLRSLDPVSIIEKRQ